MPAKQHIIRLEEAERAALEQASLSNRRSVREKTRARILLLSDTNLPHPEGGSRTDGEIARQLKVPVLTVSKVRERAHQRGTLECLVRAEQHTRKERALDGAGEAALVALTCSDPPKGAARWTLRLLRERLIEMEVVESIGQETIRSTLKKTRSSRG
jgi:hypothetical protein